MSVFNAGRVEIERPSHVWRVPFCQNAAAADYPGKYRITVSGISVTRDGRGDGRRSGGGSVRGGGEKIQRPLCRTLAVPSSSYENRSEVVLLLLRMVTHRDFCRKRLATKHGALFFLPTPQPRPRLSGGTFFSAHPFPRYRRRRSPVWFRSSRPHARKSLSDRFRRRPAASFFDLTRLTSYGEKYTIETANTTRDYVTRVILSSLAPTESEVGDSEAGRIAIGGATSTFASFPISRPTRLVVVRVRRRHVVRTPWRW